MKRTRMVIVALMLLAPRYAGAVPGTGIHTRYRDGDVRRARTRLQTDGGPALFSRAVSGDVDARCDGVCRVVLCDCEPPDPSVDRLSICSVKTHNSCTPVLVDVPVGTTRQFDHAIDTVFVQCAPGRPLDCRR